MSGSAVPPQVPQTKAPGRPRSGIARLLWPANLVVAALLTVLSATGAVEFTRLAAIVGSLYLVATLVPSNLKRLRRGGSGRAVQALARVRFPLGISAAIWFVAHAVAAVLELFDLQQPLLAQFAAPDIVLGALATLVFAALALTSNARAQAALGRRWKSLHRLVWFALPLALTHSLLAGLRYGGHVEVVGPMLLGGLVAFAVLEFVLLRGRGDGDGSPHLGLVAAGAATALAIALVF